MVPSTIPRTIDTPSVITWHCYGRTNKKSRRKTAFGLQRDSTGAYFLTTERRCMRPPMDAIWCFWMAAMLSR